MRTDVGRARDGKPASQHGQYLDHNNVPRIWTSRHLAHAGSLGVNSSRCRRMSRALENRAQIADHPTRAAAGPRATSFDPALHTAASERRCSNSTILEANGICKRSQTARRRETLRTPANWCLNKLSAENRWESSGRSELKNKHLRVLFLQIHRVPAAVRAVQAAVPVRIPAAVKPRLHHRCRLTKAIRTAQKDRKLLMVLIWSWKDWSWNQSGIVFNDTLTVIF